MGETGIIEAKADARNIHTKLVDMSALC